MFKGFIIVGISYAVGYFKGYTTGQEHTKELRDLVTDVRNSPETQEFFSGLVDAIKKANLDGSPNFDKKRIEEILGATVENPVTLTQDEVRSMQKTYVQVNLGRGVFKVESAVEPGKVVGRGEETSPGDDAQ
jgi:hypothetical protein